MSLIYFIIMTPQVYYATKFFLYQKVELAKIKENGSSSPLAVYFVYSPVASNRNKFRVWAEFDALYCPVENVFDLEQEHLGSQGDELDR